MIHELKTWPIHYRAVVSGHKTFEVRRNDRGFQVGDVLRLQEYSPSTSCPAVNSESPPATWSWRSITTATSGAVRRARTLCVPSRSGTSKKATAGMTTVAWRGSRSPHD